MELYEAIMARRSIRSYEDKPLPREVLARLLEAAREAPSASNRMPWKFITVTEASARASIAASGQYARFLDKCPLVIVGCGDAALSPSWYAVDTAIALEHIALAAVAEGLGSCWIGSFEEATVKRLLGVPDHYRVVALLALGYPKERIDLTKLASHLIHPQKSLEAIASDESFDRPWKR